MNPDNANDANSDKAQFDEYRRKFLTKSSIGVAAATLGPGVLLQSVARAKPDDQAVTDNVRWGFLIDTNKCGENCNACVTACNDENGLTSKDRPETDAQWIRKVTLHNKSTNHSLSLPMMCQHCANPPCVDVCPTGASFKRADGIVLVDKHTCIGCRYCMMACPYKARSFIHETLTDQLPEMPRGKGTVESCTLCVHRVDRGDIPACAEACAKTAEGPAILFGDLNDPDSDIAKRVASEASTQVRADFRLDPGVRYQGV
jgi:tetrathionate reductase subunit B